VAQWQQRLIYSCARRRQQLASGRVAVGGVVSIAQLCRSCRWEILRSVIDNKMLKLRSALPRHHDIVN